MKKIFNLLPKSLEDEIEREIISDRFPWFFQTSIAINTPDHLLRDMPNYDKSLVTNPTGLTHIIYSENEGIHSEAFHLVKPILNFLEKSENIEIEKLLRIRIRRTIQLKDHDETKYNLPHVDYFDLERFTTFVYYVEDSDGDTILFDEVHKIGSNASNSSKLLKESFRSTPIKGNGVLFNGLQYHAGNSPINYNSRTVINFDFVEKA